MSTLSISRLDPPSTSIPSALTSPDYTDFQTIAGDFKRRLTDRLLANSRMLSTARIGRAGTNFLGKHKTWEGAEKVLTARFKRFTDLAAIKRMVYRELRSQRSTWQTLIDILCRSFLCHPQFKPHLFVWLSIFQSPVQKSRHRPALRYALGRCASPQPQNE